MALTPDTPALYDGLTVEQYLEFIARCYDLPIGLACERIDHWLEQVWLSEKRRERVGSLSRGMKQRLAVARTLLPDPHIVLLDEPAAGLDPAGRVQFRRLLASLRDQGKAVVVSSHILADLAEVCTHIAIMERGRVLRSGTVAEVAGAEGHERCTYRVVLARRLGDLAARVAEIEDIVDVQIDGSQMRFVAENDREVAARLLVRPAGGGVARGRVSGGAARSRRGLPPQRHRAGGLTDEREPAVLAALPPDRRVAQQPGDHDRVRYAVCARSRDLLPDDAAGGLGARQRRVHGVRDHDPGRGGCCCSCPPRFARPCCATSKAG